MHQEPGRMAILVSRLDGRTVGGQRYLGGQSETNALQAAQTATSNKPVASAAGGDSGRFQWSEKKGPDVLQARPGMRSWATNICATPAACSRVTRGN